MSIRLLVVSKLAILHTTPSMFDIKFSMHALRMLGQVWRLGRRTLYIGSPWVKLIFSCQKSSKMSFGPESLKKVALRDSIHTLPPSMHHMWKDIVDTVYKATNAGKS